MLEEFKYIFFSMSILIKHTKKESRIKIGSIQINIRKIETLKEAILSK